MRFFMGQGVSLLCPKKTIVMAWMNSQVSRRQRAEKLYDDLANLLAQLGLFWDLQQLIWERPRNPASALRNLVHKCANKAGEQQPRHSEWDMPPVTQYIYGHAGAQSDTSWRAPASGWNAAVEDEWQMVFRGRRKPQPCAAVRKVFLTDANKKPDKGEQSRTRQLLAQAIGSPDLRVRASNW